ncbi:MULTISPECIES: DUF397 domain-containing protein [Streptomyces]|uniref:DUF397 domain-containing protein n=2 Tax=Streptomyces TaxID=1883 RepID=A0A3R7IAM0_9ACTN|nr:MULTISPECIES: DUF397 domain-containing protein [Streptomyces]KNE82466.1 toxin-antitoxin system, toxin component [Streptomyces fradiae]OFA49477.1 DUF397 domain-containing protein [Streptomyces fradiae]PQM22901.1 DUF397 domain-containing protein [Streptomyces xinghaiensis]RKM97376.1 DUF397 domain-containing protein [Streptomyces xinghaiensis]RNC73790.1 DUF397 domain-containing protein [Streptomyces xinghaiensis]
MEIQVHWQKSSFSGAEGPNCLEIAGVPGALLVRESDAPGNVLAASRTALAGLVAGVKAGEFDL